MLPNARPVIMIYVIIILVLVILSICCHICEYQDKQKREARWAIEREKDRQAETRAEQEKSKWINEVEPELRASKGYPIDWERRRALAFTNSEGHCSLCGSYLEAKLCCEPEKIWSYPQDCHLLSGAHVHHKRSINSGGDHSLGNLELLCTDCHSKKHPRNKLLADMACEKRARDIGFSSWPRVYRSTKHYICDICGEEIKPGSSYYGNKGRKGTKICITCRGIYYHK